MINGGFIGVDVFFVISGYLISLMIIHSVKNKRYSFVEFYARRIRRIFPALILVLLTCYGLGWVCLFATEFEVLSKHIFGGASFSSNFLLWYESGYFDHSAHTKPLLHLWSLSIEEQFYLLWPICLWLALKKKAHPTIVTLILLVCSMALNLAGIKAYGTATFYMPMTRFWELFMGAFLASLPERQVTKPCSTHFLAAGGLVLCS